MKYIEEFVINLKKNLKTYLTACKQTTIKVYYKSEMLACSTLDLPSIVSAVKSIGEILNHCKNYSMLLCPKFIIYTEYSMRPTLGLEIANIIVAFLMLNYSLKYFSIDDSQVEDETSAARMVTLVDSTLGIRIDSADYINCRGGKNGN
ncbi:hypothetical protein [Borreliella bavariensis]|uniref:hypothetical protein n=1 Tax=Borreliella bavariensis TaxID=664662 RepID=UPI001C0056A4|nr:hypothetical protein [Borreliella bavariensis]